MASYRIHSSFLLPPSTHPVLNRVGTFSCSAKTELHDMTHRGQDYLRAQEALRGQDAGWSKKHRTDWAVRCWQVFRAVPCPWDPLASPAARGRVPARHPGGREGCPPETGEERGSR